MLRRFLQTAGRGKSREEVVKQFTAKVLLKRLAKIEDIIAVKPLPACGPERPDGAGRLQQQVLRRCSHSDLSP